jgi:hypothetical protein
LRTAIVGARTRGGAGTAAHDSLKALRMAAQRSTNLLWPKLDTLEAAQTACRNGAWMAGLVALLTALLTGLDVLGVGFAARIGLDLWGFLDAALFALCAWGMSRYSRAAAIFALGLFVASRISLLRDGLSAGAVLTVLIGLGFVAAVRGAFTQRRLRRAGAVNAP